MRGRVAAIGTSKPALRRRCRCRRHLHRPVPVRRSDARASAPPRSRPAAATRRPACCTACGALGSAEAIGSIVHGTTVGTNALLERRGPKIGVITTRGFRDVLEMRRRDRRRTWGLWGDFTPIADRDLRLEVDERTLADGTVRVPVDEAAVRAAAQTLHERGAQALAIIFINAYANPENERRALAAARAVWPNEHVCALAPGAARDPRVRARLDHRAQRLPAAGRRRLPRTPRRRAGRAALRRTIPHRAVERRRDVDRDRAARCRCAPRCRVRRPASSPAPRSRAPPAMTTSSPAILAAPRSTSRWWPAARPRSPPRRPSISAS